MCVLKNASGKSEWLRFLEYTIKNKEPILFRRFLDWDGKGLVKGVVSKFLRDMNIFLLFPKNWKNQINTNGWWPNPGVYPENFWGWEWICFV